jgi:ferrochelatase
MKKGILLVNLGTPSAPTTSAVRSYLKEFLSDPLVVRVPRLIWIPILYGLILPFRSKQSAQLYQSIWTEHGSPLLVYSQSVQQKLQAKLGADYQVELAMRYGQPSLQNALNQLKDCDSIKVLPMFPQYSSTTTKSIQVKIQQLQTKQALPKIDVLRTYYNHPTYIKALANTVQQHWQTQPKADKLFVSFHGTPKSYYKDGTDPYHCECMETADLLAKELGLSRDEYLVCFQSRFGKAEWLKPYADLELVKAAKAGFSVDVICPGFAVDCLETLEEIQERYKEEFIEAGGTQFSYITSLNDSDAQIEILSELVVS